MIDRNVLLGLVVVLTGCFAGETATPNAAVANGGTTSLFFARERAGGKYEGPLGFAAPISRSGLYHELESKGIRAEKLGPLNEIKDQHVLLEVMDTFTRALGVKCSFCHDERNWAAPTARKANAAFMWDVFVGQLELTDGDAVYCDSCHHQSTIFLRREPESKPALAKYMQMEYVDELRRRDGGTHGCTTCHGAPFNPRFLPRIDDPDGWTPPVAQPGPQP
jgi:hypothetical protein